MTTREFVILDHAAAAGEAVFMDYSRRLVEVRCSFDESHLIKREGSRPDGQRKTHVYGNAQLGVSGHPGGEIRVNFDCCGLCAPIFDRVVQLWLTMAPDTIQPPGGRALWGLR